MVTIKISGMKDIKLTEREFNLMAQALKVHVMWGTGGMFGDGDDITDKQGFKMANTILKKLKY